MTQMAIFDGHNDVLSKLYFEGGRDAVPCFATGRAGALDIPRARQGGFAGGFFAVWVPSPGGLKATLAAMQAPSYDIALPDPVPQHTAMAAVSAQTALLFELERRGDLRICTSVADIQAAMQANQLAAIFHIEGAEAIDADLTMLDVLYRAGLRSLGPVWSRPTIFGEGVPFRFPSRPDIGGGLTDAGVALIQRCDTLGIMVDLSHLNEAGFWDVAKLSGRPLVATHSNAHTICPHARNLTDPQLEAIAASDGMVGLNFAVSFLREDGGKFSDTPVDIMIRHLAYLVDKLGEDRVGLGSDYDGAVVPDAVSDASLLPHLVDAMRAAAFGEALISKICHLNWLRVLALSWAPKETG